MNRLDLQAIDLLAITIHRSSDESSSSEDELIKVPTKKIIRIEDFVEKTVKNYTDEIFKGHFRVSRDSANKIIELFDASHFKSSYKSGREKISSEKQVLLSIWYLSNTESFRQIADRFDVSLSSAYRCVSRVLRFLNSVRCEKIKWPNYDDAKTSSGEFRRKQGFQNVLGLIDGSHIRINKPTENQDSYINRKGYHSILMQAVVNHQKKFIDVYVGEPGSLHDSRLLRKSSLYKKAEQNQQQCFYDGMYLLGDSAYPNLNWLVPPFRDNGRLSAQEKEFNFRHSSTRILVENAFGLLKGRFRSVQYFENVDVHFIVKLVVGACVLHNMCIDDNDLINVEDAEDVINDPVDSEVDYVQHANGRREEVFHQLFNDV